MHYILHKNECRSIKGRPEINALLLQFVNEGKLNPDIAANYGRAGNNTPLDIDNL